MVQFSDETRREPAILMNKIEHQAEAVQLRSEGRESLIVDLAAGPFDDITCKALSDEGEGQPPIDIVQPLEDPRLDRKAPERALPNAGAFILAYYSVPCVGYTWRVKERADERWARLDVCQVRLHAAP